MKTLQKWSTLSISVVALAFVATIFGGDQTFAATKNDAKATVYNYSAQPGDGYSQIARKAVQTYGINEKVKLTEAQIIAAETHLTAEAGTPLLEIGQGIALEKAKIKTVIEKVQKLDAATLAAWASYIPYVNFDTRAIGQS